MKEKERRRGRESALSPVIEIKMKIGNCTETMTVNITGIIGSSFSAIALYLR